MTKEESIAILDGFKHNPLFNEQHFEALDMAISALKGEWISVEEGEPEEFQEVLISINGTKGKKVRSATYWGNGQYHTDNGDTWRKDEKGLEAWQPKPEPYKKGE